MEPNVKLKYKGNVFCFLPCEDEKSSMLEVLSIGFQTSTSSEKVQQLAYEWYEACSDSHKSC
ncbi:hypothetical protein FOPG_08163 [Fusarium oxysporum f. sp. conglutinans race 2 54008]|nr:hypothetical protein FOVG_13040 [Fusarium oxysporum f. sp. pisi HDV247]EXL77396.1 hypothetical protein FOPG_08163 [Fusarium oxysporum f. sp. conglutinans race 2 54008]